MAKKCISNCVEPNTPILNPINLELKFNSNNTNICITKPYKENNKLKEYKKNCIKSENPSIEAITNIMVNPVLQFGSEYILFFYNINTINVNFDDVINLESLKKIKIEILNKLDIIDKNAFL